MAKIKLKCLQKNISKIDYSVTLTRKIKNQNVPFIVKVLIVFFLVHCRSPKLGINPSIPSASHFFAQP